ncbi:hypothetical protein DMENIID0001_107340 [Sergentomyia squamirostris]
MNKFNIFEIGEMIEIIKKNPIIWDRNIKPPRNFEPKYEEAQGTFQQRTTPVIFARAAIIKKIAKHFKRTPVDVEKCWHGLREKYRRLKLKEATQTKRKYNKERWEYLDKLAFLNSSLFGGQTNFIRNSDAIPLDPGTTETTIGQTNIRHVRIARKPAIVTDSSPSSPTAVSESMFGRVEVVNLSEFQSHDKEEDVAEYLEHSEEDESSEPHAKQPRIASVSPVLLSPNYSEKSNDSNPSHSNSPVFSAASSTIFPLNHTEDNKDGQLEFKLSRRSRKIAKVEDEKKELLQVLNNLTGKKSIADSYGEYLTGKLSSWSKEKQTKAIKLFNEVINKIDEEI